MAVLGVDPGTRKVGYAFVDQGGETLALGVEPLESLLLTVQRLAKIHPVRAIAVGHGTNARVISAMLAPLEAPISEVDEHDTTYRARALYFADHPPRGWRRLIPVSFQLPPRPIDDYAAVLIARRYIQSAP